MFAYDKFVAVDPPPPFFFFTTGSEFMFVIIYYLYYFNFFYTVVFAISFLPQRSINVSLRYYYSLLILWPRAFNHFNHGLKLIYVGLYNNNKKKNNIK